MKVHQYILTDEVKLTLVDTGYTIEIGNTKYDRDAADFGYETREDIIEGALEDLAILTAEHYVSTYHNDVILPAIHRLENLLLHGEDDE